jgi:hypothetical protein
MGAVSKEAYFLFGTTEEGWWFVDKKQHDNFSSVPAFDLKVRLFVPTFLSVLP